MSREVLVVIYDDLDRVAGHRTPADVTIPLNYDGRSVEVDLTRAHAEELEAFLTPYLAAGTPVSTGADRPKTPYKHRPGARAYNADMRAFADNSGNPDYNYRTHAGAWYYPKKLREDYAAHLTSGNR